MDAKNEVLSLAASVEVQSEHPLAQAVVRRAKSDGLTIAQASDFESITGGGVRATVDEHSVLIGKAELLAEQGIDGVEQARQRAKPHQQSGSTVVFVAVDGSLAAVMAVSDPIKESTPAALKTLHGLGAEGGDVDR